MRELDVLVIITLFITLEMKDLICSHFLELMEILQRRYNNWNNAIHFYSQFPLEGFRILFLNSKIILLGKYWDAILMVTHMNPSLMKTKTQFAFTITHYFNTTQLALTILHTIYNMTTTPSIHGHIHLSWFHLQRLNQPSCISLFVWGCHRNIPCWCTALRCLFLQYELEINGFSLG